MPNFFSRLFGGKRKGTAGSAAEHAEQTAAAIKIQKKARGRNMMTAPFQYVKEAGNDLIEGMNKGAEALKQGVFFAPAKPCATDGEVNAPTPEARWFTPHDGWKMEGPDSHVPHGVMATAAHSVEALFPVTADIIGELRVEVLEAENLPNMDAMLGGAVSLGSVTDAYALLVFEGCAARTSVVFDSLAPRWAADDPSSFRAFRFPITQPYSILYVNLMDYDGSERNARRRADESSSRRSRRGALSTDDPIGRVGIQLGRLHSSTTYDGWHELGYGAIEQPNGRLGSVRLRLSVTFHSERRRLLGYIKPSKTFIIPCVKSHYRKHAIFAKRGKGAKESYDWDILMVRRQPTPTAASTRYSNILRSKCLPPLRLSGLRR